MSHLVHLAVDIDDPLSIAFTNIIHRGITKGFVKVIAVKTDIKNPTVSTWLKPWFIKLVTVMTKWTGLENHDEI